MYCPKCGKEFKPNTVVCSNCGFSIAGKRAAPVKRTAAAKPAAPIEEEKASVALILGIIGIVCAWLFALAGHIVSIIGIVFGVKESEATGKYAGLILSIIGEVCAIASTIIGILSVTSLYY